MSAQKHPNAGAPWTPLERVNLAERRLAGYSLEQLIEAHGRSPNSLVSELCRQGLLVPIGRGYYAVDPIPFASFDHIRSL